MYKETVQTILKEKIIVIVRGVEKEKLLPLTQAMYDGGVRLLEITYSANGKVSDEKTAENIRALVTHFGNKIEIEILLYRIKLVKGLDNIPFYLLGRNR